MTNPFKKLYSLPIHIPFVLAAHLDFTRPCGGFAIDRYKGEVTIFYKNVQADITPHYMGLSCLSLVATAAALFDKQWGFQNVYLLLSTSN